MEEPATENPNRSLTQDQIDTFRRDGFVVIGKLLEDSVLGELRSEYDRLFDEALDGDRYRNLSAEGGAAQRHDEGADGHDRRHEPLSSSGSTRQASSAPAGSQRSSASTHWLRR